MATKKNKMCDPRACKLVSVPDDLEAAYYIYEALGRLQFSAEALLNSRDFHPDEPTKQVLLDAQALGRNLAGDCFSYSNPPTSDNLQVLSTYLLGAVPRGRA